MKDQHKLIKGYRELNLQEISGMNTAKSLGNKLQELIAELEASEDTDKRWLSIAKTDLQTGIMSLVRSIAKPTSF